MVEAKNIRILIVENSTYIQDMVQKIRTVVSGISISGVASSGKQAVQLVIDLEPDVVLLGKELEDMNSIQVAKSILERSPEAGVIFVMDESPSDQQLAAMIDAGARDCVSSRPSLDDLATAIRQTSLVG